MSFEDPVLWKKFLAKAREEAPTEGALDAMVERAIQKGALHVQKMERAWASLLSRLIAQTPWEYIECYRATEHLSPAQIAIQLGVSRAQLSSLKQSPTTVTAKSLASFCREFCTTYPEFPRGKLMRVLKRAIRIDSRLDEES